MRQKMTLSIDNPCSQNLSGMEKNTVGRFCTNCQKSVIDFSNHSDRELHEFFKNEHKAVCGSFREGQLDRILVPKVKRRRAGGLILGGLGLLAFTTPAYSKEAQDQEPTFFKTVDQPEVQAAKPTPKTQHHRLIKGVVVDELGLSLPGVTILIKGSEKGTVSDLDGYFELDVASETDSLTLVFRFVGFETKERMLEISQTIHDLGEIKLAEDSFALTGEVVIAGGVCVHKKISVRRFWHKVENIFRKVF